MSIRKAVEVELISFRKLFSAHLSTRLYNYLILSFDGAKLRTISDKKQIFRDFGMKFGISE